MKKFRVWWLKRRARSAYAAYCRATASLSCGSAIAGVISGEVQTAKSRFNSCMDLLAKLDPATPPARL